MLILALSFSFKWQTIWTETIDILVLGGVSQILLTIAYRGQWFSVGRKQLLIRGLLGCIAGGLLSSLILYPLSSMEDAGYYSSPWVLIASDTVWNTCVLSMWGGFFLAFYFHDRHLRLEVERALMMAAVQEAKFASLKSQLNPHFLFNSFNLLRSLIQNKPAAAREAVTHLAGMMRYFLAISNRDTIRIREELDFVEAYLALESMRHEERLRVFSHIEAGVEEKFIPPMLLQTLIENGVKHGINQHIEGVEVTYDVWENSEGIHMRVTNNGHLLETAPLTGTGLLNATTRLRLLYGDAAFLKVTQEANRVVADAMWPSTNRRVSNENLIN